MIGDVNRLSMAGRRPPTSCSVTPFMPSTIPGAQYVHHSSSLSWSSDLAVVPHRSSPRGGWAQQVRGAGALAYRSTEHRRGTTTLAARCGRVPTAEATQTPCLQIKSVYSAPFNTETYFN